MVCSPSLFLLALSGTAPLLLLSELLIAPAALLIVRGRQVLFGIALGIVRMLFPEARLFLLSLQTVKPRIHRLLSGQLQDGSLRQNVNAADAGDQQHENRAEGLEKLIHGIRQCSAENAAAGAVLHAPSVNGGRRITALRSHIRPEQLGQDAKDQIQPGKSQNFRMNPVVVCLTEDIIQIPPGNQNGKDIGSHTDQSEHKIGKEGPDDAKAHEIAQKQEDHGAEQCNQGHITLHHRIPSARLLPSGGGPPAPISGGSARTRSSGPPGRRRTPGALSCPCTGTAAARCAACG